MLQTQTQSTAIMGTLSQEMRRDMETTAREVARTTTFSAQETAKAYFFLASAGLDATQSIAALPRVAAFAQAGMFDMARATELLADSQSALGLAVRDDAVANMENMVRVSDVLVRAGSVSNATVEQFAEALTNRAGPSLRAVNKDIEEGVAVLAVFADQGIKGVEAGSRLDIVLRDLQTQAIRNREEFRALGIEVFDAQGKMGNLGGIVGQMETAFAGMSDEQLRATLITLGFTAESTSAMLSLLGSADAIKKYEAALREAGGTTADVASKQLQSLQAQLKLLKSEGIDLAIAGFDALRPVIMEQIIPAARGLIEQVRSVCSSPWWNRGVARERGRVSRHR